MIAHLLIIFNIFLPFSTCSIIDKAFLSLSWGGEAEVSISLYVWKGKWEREMGGKWEIREGKGNKRGNERVKGNKRGNERKREN